MADALVVSSIMVLLEKTLSLATDGIGLIFGFKKDLEALKGSAARICAVLTDAEDKQRHNQAVQIWLKRLEAVAFEAENVLDELHYEKLRRQLKGKERYAPQSGVDSEWSKISHISIEWIRDVGKRIWITPNEMHSLSSV